MFRKRLAIIGLALTAGFVMSGQALAQAGACGEERKVPTGTLDEATYKRMNKAYELVGEEQYDEEAPRTTHRAPDISLNHEQPLADGSDSRETGYPEGKRSRRAVRSAGSAGPGTSGIRRTRSTTTRVISH